MSIHVVASSTATMGVVAVGSIESDSLDGPKGGRRVIFRDAKGRSDDNLGDFDSDGDGD